MKTKWIKSAIPIYVAAGIWVLYGLIRPLYQLPDLLMALGLSLATYFASGKFFPGRKVEVEVNTGDAQVDAMLRKCRADLQGIKAANEGISSPKISAQIDRLEQTGAKILSSVADKKGRADQVRKFMNYYLPTTGKLLSQYQTLAGLNATGESIRKAMVSVENSLDMIGQAFDKQLDNLYKDEALDITSDVRVLETMMAGDGLTDEGIQKAIKEDQRQCQTTSN